MAPPPLSARLPGLAGRRLMVRVARQRQSVARAGRGFGGKKEKAQPSTDAEGSSDVAFGGAEPLEERLPPQEPSVPDEVVDRALTRMLTFSGIPFGAGLLFFPAFWYLKVVKHVDVPMWVVYAVSSLFVGVSLAGISYGLLSTSGTPSQKSFLGVDDFKKNVGNLTKRK
mmetsp:Transcript_4709/g.16519  ORF Transcript_4709/g.16519 Transcript_4709/m.16519 type:complete len:169 (-) Transcript_4709:2006-2512(-)